MTVPTCLADLAPLPLLITCVVIYSIACFMPTLAIGVGTLVLVLRHVAEVGAAGVRGLRILQAVLVTTPLAAVCWVLVTGWASFFMTADKARATNSRGIIVVSQVVFVGMSVWYFLPRWTRWVVSPWQRHPYLDKSLSLMIVSILLFWAIEFYVYFSHWY